MSRGSRDDDRAELTDQAPDRDLGHNVVTAETISISRCRTLLGDEARGLSDVEVDTIRRHAHTMAIVLIEIVTSTSNK